MELAERHRKVLMVGHVFLFNPGIEFIQHLMTSADLGDIRYLSSIRTNLGPIRSDVNAAFDLAAHDVAIFNWLLNSTPLEVTATGGCFVRSTIEDVVFASLRYPNGALANIQASWLNPLKVRQMTVVGSQKMVTWDDLNMSTPVAIYDRGAGIVPAPTDFGEFSRIRMWDGDIRLPRIAVVEPLKAQMQHILSVIRQSIPCRSGAAFSAEIVRVLEAISQSMRLHGQPVRLS